MSMGLSGFGSDFPSMESHPVGYQAIQTPTQVERSYTFGEHGLPWIPSGHVVGEEDELEFEQTHRDDYDGQIAGARDFDPPPKGHKKKSTYADPGKGLHEAYEAYVPRAEKRGGKKLKSKPMKEKQFFANDDTVAPWYMREPTIPQKSGDAFDAFDEEMFDREMLVK